jgi:hypothetical protein
VPVPGDIVFEGQVTWANSAPLNTVKTLDLPHALADGDYEVEVRNPSTVTDLAVSAQIQEAADASYGGGSTRYPTHDTWVAAKSNVDGVTRLVKEWPLGSVQGRVSLQNSTILGVADGFTADVRIRHVA